MSKKLPLRLTAVAFAAALTLAGTAEAGSLSAGPRAAAEIAPLSAAWGWLSGLWQDVTVSLLQMSASTSEPPAPTGQEGQCTNCADSDAGWVIDPNGGS